jgi:hypothetical protein
MQEELNSQPLQLVEIEARETQYNLDSPFFCYYHHILITY